MNSKTLYRRVIRFRERTFTGAEVQNMLISVGINSYFAGESDTIMKPSLIAEKYIFDNFLTKDLRKKNG